MKITCSSCGSKYTIADAKVQGKKVKVRCKGCKESILVDGTQIGADGTSGSEDDDDSEDDGDAPAAASPAKPQAAATAPATAAKPAATVPTKPAAAAPAKAASPAKTAEQKPVNSPALSDGAKSDLWSVNLSDDDSRDMTLDELVAGWKNGTVTSDAYVWKDGMGDWKPILEVGELKLRLGTLKKGGGVVSSVSTAVAKSGAKMDDLFGGADAAGSKDAGKGPGLPGPGEKPTGARNDSSVLFSLDSLTGPAGGAPQAAPSGGSDLFAGLGNVGSGSLAGNVDLLTAPAKDPPPAPAGNRAQPPPAAKGKSKMALILALVGGLVVIGGAVFAFSGGSEEEKPAEPSAEEATAAAAEKEAAEKAKKELEDKMAKLAKMEEELKKKAEAEKKAEPSAEEKKKQEELEKEKAEAEKKEAAEKAASGSTKPGPSTSPSPAPAASGSAAFDVGAARAALSAAAANSAACAKPGGPTGTGKVQITFATSGRVTTATLVSGPFGGTAVGGCVSSTFRRARVPAFSGSPQTVAKSFTVN